MAAFLSLPIEMKENVFAFIRQMPRMTTICLAWREWRKLMASKLIHIRRGVQGHGMPCDKDVETVVQFLIGALPRNNLVMFSSELALRTSFVLNLVQCHQTLRTLNVQIRSADSRSPPGLTTIADAEWISPLLDNITTLSIWLGTNGSFHRSSNFLIRSAPKLRELTLKGGERVAPFVHRDRLLSPFGHVNLGDPQTLRLSRLALVAIDFTEHTTTLVKYLDMSYLQNHRIIRCRSILHLLAALATQLTDASCDLRSFDVCPTRVPTADEELVCAIEGLIENAHGLRNTWVDVGKGRLTGPSPIQQHGASLRNLALCKAQDSDMLHICAMDLTSMLEASPLLKGLALNLGPVDLGDIKDLSIEFDLDSPDGTATCKTNFVATLDAIASHHRLQALRMLTLPIIDYGYATNPTASNGTAIEDSHVYMTQITMLNFATEIFRYLYKRGSTIKYLAVAPACIHEFTRPKKDENGHQWPWYYYVRSRTVDVRGMQEVVALPATYLREEMPVDAQILFHPF
ncbi:hypothetical protein EK21DRAFT_90566 [Setomelanomma holmii]|uniref:F-box domain-containing protein n=1 Tax=Setomelanomma holmii TaxID=210430 RepID=A0A9P4H7G0_9PLEO|nr:hypothetical protein EK21DRAFT_90566 [Setomelanomma holmii]